MTAKLVAVLRILLGAVFVYAAYTKLRQPWLIFALSIDSYRLLPAWAVFTVARTLPWLELLIGVLLVSGKYLKYVAPAATVLLVAFYAAMYHAYAVGASIDCGCFGVGEAVSAATLTRDGVLLAGSLALTVLTRKSRPGGPDGFDFVTGCGLTSRRARLGSFCFPAEQKNAQRKHQHKTERIQ